MLPELDELARDRVAAVLGSGTRVIRTEKLHTGDHHAVLLLTLDRAPWALVLKAAGPGARVDLRRTAAVAALARAAGAPVAEVLAAGGPHATAGASWLLQEHVDGLPWRRVRPVLDQGELAAAHRQLAAAVLAVQEVRPASFGELDAAGRPAGDDLQAALRRRAELRIADPRRRALFCGLLEREAGLLAAGPQVPTLCHDDLHHENVLFRPGPGGWRLAALLDWDKAWAGPAESDVARMAFWDDMTGPGFWEVYRGAVPPADGEAERARIHQLAWCLEYPEDTARHRADTADLCRRLGLRRDG